MPFQPIYNTVMNLRQGPIGANVLVMADIQVQQLRPYVVLNDHQATAYDGEIILRFNCKWKTSATPISFYGTDYPADNADPLYLYPATGGAMVFRLTNAYPINTQSPPNEISWFYVIGYPEYL